MEKWCGEMGFKPDNMDEFKKLFKKCCQPGMKDIWSHIIHHVRPKDEVQMIKKQCLLHKLRTSKHLSKIQVNLKSMKDHCTFLAKEKEHYSLKKVLEDIEKKKVSIKEHIDKLELSGLRLDDDEELLRERIYKLDQLRKKSITVKRVIDKLTYNTKLLQLITNEPDKVLGFGSDTTTWEQLVLMTVKELPRGSECHAIISKMSELAKDSKLPPVPHWDRTEMLALLENNFSSMVEKLNNCKAHLKEEECEIKKLKIEIIGALIKEDLVEEDIANVFDECEDEHLNNAEAVSKELIFSKPPYKLAVEDQLIRRLQRQINDKVKDIIELLPFESEKITNNLEFDKAYNVDHLPMKLPVENLINSVAEEVALFSKIRLNDPKETEGKYSFIHKDLTTEVQLMRLKEELETLEKLISFLKEIGLLTVPSIDQTNDETIKEQTEELHRKLNEATRTIDELLTKLNVKYNKLREAFNFLRKEPLNEKLTGIEISGEDISYWLKKYKKTKVRFDHEKLVQKNMQKEGGGQN